MGERAFERAAQVADRGAGRAVAGAPTAGLEATLLSLQRTAGNAATGRFVRDRQVLARCGGGGCSCGGSCGGRDPLEDEELLAAGRSALKRAVAARAPDRQVLARCGGGRCSCGGSCGNHDPLEDEELLGAGQSALKRAVVARAPNRKPTDNAPIRTGRRQLQRVPLFVPLPLLPPSFDPSAAKAWTTKVPCTGLTKPDDKERCDADCTPYGNAFTASAAWGVVAQSIDAILEGGIPQATNGEHFLLCPDVHSAYHAYLGGTGRPNFHWKEPDDSSGCVLKSMKNDAVHHPAAEDPIMQDIKDHHLAELVATPGAAVPLSKFGVQEDQRPGAAKPGLNLAFNDGPYGLLFGGTGDGVAFDSEYGPDLRRLTGFVTAAPDPAGSSGACTKYTLKFDFDWYVKDAVDFCPGNTEPWNAFVHDFGMLGTMSRLEASGMARDIKVEATYRRTRTLTADFCPPPPAPKKKCKPLVLHEDTFHFPFGSAVPDTDDRAVYAELERTYGGKGLPELDSSLTALNVVGHTDSRGEEHGFDNVGLSRARATYVADLLNKYPADGSAPPVLASRGIRPTVTPMGAAGAALTDRDPPGDIHGKYLGPGPGTPAYANRRVEIQPVGPVCPTTASSAEPASDGSAVDGDFVDDDVAATAAV